MTLPGFFFPPKTTTSCAMLQSYPQYHFLMLHHSPVSATGKYYHHTRPRGCLKNALYPLAFPVVPVHYEKPMLVVPLVSVKQLPWNKIRKTLYWLQVRLIYLSLGPEIAKGCGDNILHICCPNIKSEIKPLLWRTCCPHHRLKVLWHEDPREKTVPVKQFSAVARALQTLQ